MPPPTPLPLQATFSIKPRDKFSNPVPVDNIKNFDVTIDGPQVNGPNSLNPRGTVNKTKTLNSKPSWQDSIKLISSRLAY